MSVIVAFLPPIVKDFPDEYEIPETITDDDSSS